MSASTVCIHDGCYSPSLLNPSICRAGYPQKQHYAGCGCWLAPTEASMPPRGCVGTVAPGSETSLGADRDADRGLNPRASTLHWAARIEQCVVSSSTLHLLSLFGPNGAPVLGRQTKNSNNSAGSSTMEKQPGQGVNHKLSFGEASLEKRLLQLSMMVESCLVVHLKNRSSKLPCSFKRAFMQWHGYHSFQAHSCNSEWCTSACNLTKYKRTAAGFAERCTAVLNAMLRARSAEDLPNIFMRGFFKDCTRPQDSQISRAPG